MHIEKTLVQILILQDKFLSLSKKRKIVFV